MTFYSLQVFQTVATERSLSRAAEQLFRTQPAISLAFQRLEAALGERLIDRAGKDLLLTDAGQIALDDARRGQNLKGGLEVALAERGDSSAGRLTIGANESTTLSRHPHPVAYRRADPRVHVQVRRSLSSQIPAQIVEGDLELGVIP